MTWKKNVARAENHKKHENMLAFEPAKKIDFNR